MTDKKDSAKKGWHTSRVNKRYKEICNAVNHDEEVIKVMEDNKPLFQEVANSTNELLKMRLQYDVLMSKISMVENIMEDMPIGSVRDLLEFEKNGKPSKATFNDLCKAGSIKRKGLAVTESNNRLSHNAQMAQYDILEAHCNALLKLLEKEDEVSCDSGRPALGTR